MSYRYRCVNCGYPIIRDDDVARGIKLNSYSAIHWRTCVSKKDWPAYMLVKSNAKVPAQAIIKTISEIVQETVPIDTENVMVTDKSSTEGAESPGSSVLPEGGSVGTPSLSVEL
jgi:hypothetical protein